MASINASTADALRAWQAGESVWTVEMGGIGPGYEQAIQVMAFDFLGWMHSHPPEDGWDEMKGDKWRMYSSECEEACKQTVKRIGPSGAQFGAAMNIASVFARQGYAEALSMVGPDRHILVSKRFPVESA